VRSSLKRSTHNKNSDSIEDDGQLMIYPSTSSLNTIMCAYADVGLSAKAIELYNEFEDLQCNPDENTFAFLMDSALMNVSTAIPPNFVTGQQSSLDDENLMSWLETQTDAADAIFDAATEMGFGSNKHLLHSYVKLLCNVGKVDEAMYLLEERLDGSEKISLASFEYAALSQAKLGKMAAVESIVIMSRQAGYESGLSKAVVERIKRISSTLCD